MVVVTAILALLATMIIPSLVAIQRSRADRELEASIIRLPAEARNRAIQFKTPMMIHVENNEVVLEPDTEALDNMSTNQTTTNMVPNNSNNTNNSTSTDAPTTRIDLNNDIQVDSAQTNGETTDTGNWKWTVYPDGSADSAGLVFRVGSDRKSLYLPAVGDSQWIQGDLPDTSQERWQAGELEQRATT